MGNIFSHETEGDRVKHDPKSKSREENNFLTSRESESLHFFFDRVKAPNAQEAEKHHLSRIFKSSTLVGVLLERDTLADYKCFKAFIVSSARLNDTTSVKVIWDHCPTVNTLDVFFTLLCEIGGVDIDSVPSVAQTLSRSVTKYVASQLGGGETIAVEFPALMEWIHIYGASIPKVIATYTTNLCFQAGSIPSFSPFFAPYFDVHSEITRESGVFPLALCMDSLQGPWKRLYTSNVDGLSFNRVVHHILGYGGPTCILIRAQGSESPIFGAYCNDPWKENNRFFGSSKNFLFTLHPELKILRSKNTTNGSFQWLNTKSYSLPHGLGLGGTTEAFRIFIPDTLEGCAANSSCLTYELGNLLPRLSSPPPGFSATRGSDGLWSQDHFEIDCLEIWACGGQEAVQQGLLAQKKNREIKDEAIQKARKVDKAQFFNNSFDAEFLLSNTFAHRQQVRDDAEFGPDS